LSSFLGEHPPKKWGCLIKKLRILHESYLSISKVYPLDLAGSQGKLFYKELQNLFQKSKLDINILLNG
jgi:hypothetical protein